MNTLSRTSAKLEQKQEEVVEVVEVEEAAAYPVN